MIKFRSIQVDMDKMTITTNNGTELNMAEISDIFLAYERICTAEYILDNYKSEHSIDNHKAFALADKVRICMDVYGYDEGKAINRIIEMEEE